ncbi:ExeA family protein [Desulfoferrobacter suflitae]|uniref:ExeA family protein n=1 Tax=Desulfoferrobacter suflitae TaxID=2865782 RepID=UPI0021643B25|nr:AAA family ATPase [Desulfoferrobacter suflitae]MCK8603898.1 AAA family ATPase [Desulfoferrobacter suflitae]
MYLDFFALKKRPFVLSPDPEFLFLSRGHDLALTHLEYGLFNNMGIVALTGEVGAGKTTLLKYLFERVKRTLDVGMIFNTHLDPQAFLEALVGEFELDVPAAGKSNLIDALYKHFLRTYSQGDHCVIVVDEAQNLPLDTFEELRMLSNLEAGNESLVQIVLVGQPQLRERLFHPSLLQLAQRVSVYYHLAPLSVEEVGQYIEHRLKVAGYEKPAPLFREEAVELIAQASRGTPRIINTICDGSLTYAFAEEIAVVDREMVAKVIEDNELLLVSAREAAPVPAVPEPAAGCAQASFPDDVRCLVGNLYSRLESIEERLRMLETARSNGAVSVLQDVLTKERHASLQYVQKLTLLNQRYKMLQSQLEKMKREKQEAELAAETGKKRRRFWS